MNENQKEMAKIEPTNEIETKKINLKEKKQTKKSRKNNSKMVSSSKNNKRRLEKVIIKQNDDFDNLKNLFTEYYDTKIQSRKKFKIIKKYENGL